MAAPLRFNPQFSWSDQTVDLPSKSGNRELVAVWPMEIFLKEGFTAVGTNREAWSTYKFLWCGFHDYSGLQSYAIGTFLIPIYSHTQFVILWSW